MLTGSNAPFNWLTQSSLDTLATDVSMSLGGTQTQSSLLFTVGRAGARPGAEAAGLRKKTAVASRAIASRAEGKATVGFFESKYT